METYFKGIWGYLAWIFGSILIGVTIAFAFIVMFIEVWFYYFGVGK
jgi:hypothetical protein